MGPAPQQHLGNNTSTCMAAPWDRLPAHTSPSSCITGGSGLGTRSLCSPGVCGDQGAGSESTAPSGGMHHPGVGRPWRLSNRNPWHGVTGCRHRVWLQIP